MLTDILRFFRRSHPDYGELKLHNTLSGEIEPFEPLTRGKAGLYHCGPTVYNDAHIGNLRAYVTSDILRRVLEWNDYTVRQVINITDVGHLVNDGDEGEDKMTKALEREGKPKTLQAMKEIGDFYTKRFLEDLQRLNIEMPHKLPKASEHIAEDIALIDQLEEKGHVYKTSDGLYFDTTTFPKYGKLGRINLTALKEGARVHVNPEKRNPTDFALWKFNDIGWESPWGAGFPGWHIECSAMSMKYLGETLDIHTGGIDHIATHHNNEIAQSESATGHLFARYWLHNAFVNVEGGKMAKSQENFLRLKTLTDEGIDPLAYRYWLLTAHYRSPLTFTMEAVKGANVALKRLYDSVSQLPNLGAEPDQAYLAAFASAINYDLNTPQAIATMWDLVKDSDVQPAVKRATLLAMDSVLGLKLEDQLPVDVPGEVQALIDEREGARTRKDFETADILRQKIERLGFKVEDTDTGPKTSRTRRG